MQICIAIEHQGDADKYFIYFSMKTYTVVIIRTAPMRHSNEYGKCPKISYTNMSDKMAMHTVQTQIRLLLKEEQSDQGLQYLPFQHVF